MFLVGYFIWISGAITFALHIHMIYSYEMFLK